LKTKTYKKFTDQELYLLLQQKDKAAFAQLYDQYHCIIYGLAVKAVRSKEFADEVTELTFLNVWKSLHLFKNQQKTFCVWMVCILINTAKEFLESKNIKFILNTENFPVFTFEMYEEKVC